MSEVVAMERKLKITERYLYIPICADCEERKLQIFLDDEETFRKKIYEFKVPIAESETEEYPYDYFAEIPMEQYLDKEILICIDAPEAFTDLIKNEGKQEASKERRPLIHFTADTGWTNDPNGMIYANGVYHLYFQYNPFNITWENMSWGHAVSTDLLHWKQEDTVLFPDESGTMFSGCAVANERELLGLPKDALLFFYTAAGGSNQWSKGLAFTQKIAYSLDGGKTLIKMSAPCLGTIEKENRDPKIYWHEETQAYIMALFLEDNDFAILRSKDLFHWEQSDRFTLEDAWECPDLFHLISDAGESCWFFWSADGFYYEGEFDGFHFKTQGKKQKAYVNGIPYAAQSYFGVADRVISIPWLRIKNDGRMFTGAYGIPVELACKKTANGFILIQRPVRELMQQAKRIDSGNLTGKGEGRKAYVLEMSAKEDYKGNYLWKMNGSVVEYQPQSGQFLVDEDNYQIGCGYKEFLFIIDDRILEVFFDGGIQLGTFVLKEADIQLEIPYEAAAQYTVYEVE
ncbi:MAG: glycoside hydrolase family 32 protein [Lachnospiraceae bacterium]|nr:glycoside hydrolase family 32 protein [Lachnospiraceae bacterium]